MLTVISVAVTIANTKLHVFPGTDQLPQFTCTSTLLLAICKSFLVTLIYQVSKFV